jgi:phosphoesterase RecJ-like protein
MKGVRTVQGFKEFFQTIAPQRILITTHENADPDALCSAFSLRNLIERLYPETKVTLYFDGLSLVAQQIAEKFNLDITSPVDISCDGIIIVDANSPEQLGELKTRINLNLPKLIVDHHSPPSNLAKITQYAIIDEDSSAACEVIFNIYQFFNVKLSLDMASLIFLGILYDSRHLLLATNRTIHIIDELINFGIEYADMIEVLTLSMDRTERIARLKAAQRIVLHEFDGWIVAVSHVSAFEASACRALIGLGADVALVYGEKQDEIRFSTRATAEILKKTDLNLANIMEKVGPVMHGEGGGHEGAAGCNGNANLEGGLELALELLKTQLTQKSELLKPE